MDRIKDSRLTLFIGTLLGAVTLVVYWPVRHFGFLNWDDLTYISRNDHVRGGLTWSGITWSFTHSYSSNWHPLTWLSHMLDCQLYGLNPAGPHLTNVVFHAANTVLLFLLLRTLTAATWRSAFVAALFALHPLHVESVAWIAERKDVLSGFFFILTLWAYARYAQVQSQQAERAARPAVPSSRFEVRGSRFKVRSFPPRFWYWAATLMFACGLMSKPMLVTVPFVLLLLDYWPLGRMQKGQVRSPASRITSTLRNAATEDGHHASRITFHVSRFTLLPLLLEKLPFFALSAASCLITFLAQKAGGAVASFAIIPLDARIANAAVAYVEYLAKLFWPINLSPIYLHPGHWGFWPVTGAAAGLVLLTAAVWLGRRRFPYALMGWLWFLGMLVPVIGIVQVGSQAFADRYTYLPLLGIMIALVWLGAEAVRPLAKASPVIRSVLPAVLALAVVAGLAWRTREQLANWKDTRALFSHALALTPNNVQALYGLGAYMVDTGSIEEGKRLLEDAIRLQPAYPEALGTMANLLDGQGSYAEAIRFYQAALKAQPDQEGVLNNLAWLMATCPDTAFRNGPEAVRLATRACELTGYAKPLLIGTLAAAQAEAGDFSAAIATAERAADLATTLHLEDIAAKNRELIQLYRQGQPFHEKRGG
jgi:tetratricopeptide (TPR) repeat protein